MSVQILLAIALGALFVGGLALHAIGILRDESWAWQRRGSIWDPAVPAIGLTDEQLRELGIGWNGQRWASVDGSFELVEDAVQWARTHRRPS